MIILGGLTLLPAPEDTREHPLSPPAIASQDDVTTEAQQHSSQSSESLQGEQLEPSSEDRKVQAVVEVRIEVRPREEGERERLQP